MATENTRPAWVFALVFLHLLVSMEGCAASPHTEATLKRLLRNKRQACTDGSYTTPDGKTCCQCGAGWKLTDHCKVQQDDRNCAPCENRTYNSHPNSKRSCEPCTSCHHPNANLEEDEGCTAARDATCRCKKDHYCIDDLPDQKSCRLCHPCKVCGAAGIKVACTARSNTVCNEETNGTRTKTVGIVLGVLALFAAVIGAAVFFIRKRKQPSHRPTSTSEEELPLTDLQPYLSEIVDVIGWKDMKNIAMRSNISRATIEYCERDHPRDAQEQTLQLLEAWIESQGREASRKLIQMLRNTNKNRKAEKLIAILSGDSAA